MFIVVKSWNVKKLYQTVAQLKGADINSFYLHYCGKSESFHNKHKTFAYKMRFVPEILTFLYFSGVVYYSNWKHYKKRQDDTIPI